MKIVITGGSKGIGRAIAERFSAAGYDIALCARGQTALEDTAGALRNAGAGEVITYAADLGDRTSAQQFGDFVLERWGAPDILVNNAGLFYPGSVLDEADGALEAMLGVNLLSAYHLTRRLAPAMTAKGRGHIFNMCSIASLAAYPNGGSYTISKFALLGMSRVLREELRHKGIRVTAVLPGATWSDSWAGVDLPESRLMQAADIAACVWTASQLGENAVIEELIVRPQLGDL